MVGVIDDRAKDYGIFLPGTLCLCIMCKDIRIQRKCYNMTQDIKGVSKYDNSYYCPQEKNYIYKEE